MLCLAGSQGKEAALFFPTGTMSNQVAARCHVAPLSSVSVDHRGHMLQWESGGLAQHSAVMPVPVFPSEGRFHVTWADVKRSLVHEGDNHYAPTSLVCLENTLGGVPFPQADIVEIKKGLDEYSSTREQRVALHLDGARY